MDDSSQPSSEPEQEGVQQDSILRATAQQKSKNPSIQQNFIDQQSEEKTTSLQKKNQPQNKPIIQNKNYKFIEDELDSSPEPTTQIPSILQAQKKATQCNVKSDAKQTQKLVDLETKTEADLPDSQEESEAGQTVKAQSLLQQKPQQTKLSQQLPISAQNNSQFSQVSAQQGDYQLYQQQNVQISEMLAEPEFSVFSSENHADTSQSLNKKNRPQNTQESYLNAQYQIENKGFGIQGNEHSGIQVQEQFQDKMPIEYNAQEFPDSELQANQQARSLLQKPQEQIQQQYDSVDYPSSDYAQNYRAISLLQKESVNGQQNDLDLEESAEKDRIERQELQSILQKPLLGKQQSLDQSQTQQNNELEQQILDKRQRNLGKQDQSNRIPQNRGSQLGELMEEEEIQDQGEAVSVDQYAPKFLAKQLDLPSRSSTANKTNYSRNLYFQNAPA